MINKLWPSLSLVEAAAHKKDQTHFRRANGKKLYMRKIHPAISNSRLERGFLKHYWTMKRVLE